MTLQIIPNIVNKYFIISINFFFSLQVESILIFNLSKPNKFHLKLFMVSEHKTGYMCGFSVYTGKVANELLAENAVSTDECTTMTKTVMGLLQRTCLLDSYRCVYFDNCSTHLNYWIKCMSTRH